MRKIIFVLRMDALEGYAAVVSANEKRFPAHDAIHNHLYGIKDECKRDHPTNCRSYDLTIKRSGKEVIRASRHEDCYEHLR